MRRALEYNNAIDINNENPSTMVKYDHFLGVEGGLKIKDMTEPTDIIWENRAVTGRWKRQTVVYIIIVIMLCISAYAIFSLSIQSFDLKKMYPPRDCTSDRGFIKNEYSSSDSEKVLNELREDALDEYKRALVHRGEG